MALSLSELAAIATELATRPGHEKVRTNIWAVLTSQLGFPSASIEFEKYIGRGEVTGRADALLGRTVFEFKKDLRRELVDAETQLRDYIEDRENKTGHSYTGIATDGAQYRAYRLDAGILVQIGEFAVDRGKPRDFVNWIDQATAARDDLDPEPEIVAAELGKNSLVYGIAKRSLRELRRHRPRGVYRQDAVEGGDNLRLTPGGHIGEYDVHIAPRRQRNARYHTHPGGAVPEACADASP